LRVYSAGAGGFCHSGGVMASVLLLFRPFAFLPFAFWPRLDAAPARAYHTKRLPLHCCAAMSESDKPPRPAASAPLSPQKAAEKQRLAEALRENLRRRKAQARGRREADDGNSGPEGQ
jgi:hypothetical protein